MAAKNVECEIGFCLCLIWDMAKWAEKRLSTYGWDIWVVKKKLGCKQEFCQEQLLEDDLKHLAHVSYVLTSKAQCFNISQFACDDWVYHKARLKGNSYTLDAFRRAWVYAADSSVALHTTRAAHTGVPYTANLQPRGWGGWPQQIPGSKKPQLKKAGWRTW